MQDRIKLMKQYNVVSYGGGVDSTAMILRMIDEKIPIDYVVFADTGVEIPETYETLKHMQKLLDENSIPLVTVRNFGMITLLQRCIKRNVFPDTYRRWCTRDFKIAPIHKFYKKTLKGFINEFMGIDCAETKRIRIAKEPFIKKCYPLVDWKMDRKACLQYIEDKEFPFTIKSGCYFCPFNSPTRWQWLKKTHPKLFALSVKLERMSKHFPKKTLAKGGLDNVDNLQTNENDDYCGNGFS